MGDVQLGLDEIRKFHAERTTLDLYYNGVHTLAFATEKFKNAFGKHIQAMRDNLCPIIVDSTSDRMEVVNFSGDEAAEVTATAAWKLWQDSEMELLSNLTHTEALKTGSAFVIVWPDKEGKAKFWLQNSLNCGVVTDAETEEPLFGAKLWETSEKKYRLNLYYPDRIEKYETQKSTQSKIVELKESAFMKIEAAEGESLANPYGVVPMFKFETNPVLSDAIPIQDALNKTLCDKLVAMEFAAFPQRWATGLEFTDENGSKTDPPFKAGLDRLWTSEGDKTKFGAFETADLEQFLKVADSYRLEMARVSGTPLHFFSINTSDAISGEALKTLESRFTKRVSRLCLTFGPIWGRAMQLALKIEGTDSSDNLTVQWASPEQRSEKEFLETLGLKRANLDIPVEVLQEEYGYGVEDLAKFKAANMALTEAAETPDEAVNTGV